MKLKIKKQNVLLKLILLISFVASGCATDGRFRIFTTPIETRKAWSEGHPKLINILPLRVIQFGLSLSTTFVALYT